MAEIFSIEDDVITSKLIRKVLEKSGHSMQHASDGVVALDMLKSAAIKPDLILMDVNMPQLNGYEVCQIIQAEPSLALIPIIFLTASISDEERERAFQVGAVDFIQKPIQHKVFLKVIETHLKTQDELEAQVAEQAVRNRLLNRRLENTPSDLSKQVESSLPQEPSEPPSDIQTESPLTRPLDEWRAEMTQELVLSRSIEQRDKSLEMAAAFEAGQDMVQQGESDQLGVSAYGSSNQEVTIVGSKEAPRADNISSKVPEFSRFVAFLLGITQKQDAVPVQEIQPQKLYELSIQFGISNYEMAKFISGFTKIKYMAGIDRSQITLDVLSPRFCKKHHILPITDEQGDLAFVISQPFDIELQDALRRFKGALLFISEPEMIQDMFAPGEVLKKAPSPQTEKDLTDVLDQLSDKFVVPDESDSEELDDLDENDAPIIRLVNGLIENAYIMGASDIHIEPQEFSVFVRYRIDGELKIMNELKPRTLINPMVTRIKIMANLDIAERRLPQDGRINFSEFSRKSKQFDLRVATAPMNYGEKVVMRIIDKEKATLPLKALGFSDRHLHAYRKGIRTPYGMILHVGPTGSGKSMTLYSALADIYRPELNIQTAEDPIEYTLPGLSQLQIKSEIGLTFSRALRSFLRQDPDIILVGEIRDKETAQIAIEAAMTGHLLLSTLHTNDAAATVMRFLEMGIEPFMISTSLVMVCAQRLLRRLCRHCKASYQPDEQEMLLAGIVKGEKATFYRAVGCDECNHLGYKGRIGIHELMIPNDLIRKEMAKPNTTSDILKQIAVESCEMTTLYWDGMEKVWQGITTLDEVLTRVRPDNFDSRPYWMKGE